jgi:hypothetical protein
LATNSARAERDLPGYLDGQLSAMTVSR